jgi:hypothetical protein
VGYFHPQIRNENHHVNSYFGTKIQLTTIYLMFCCHQPADIRSTKILNLSFRLHFSCILYITNDLLLTICRLNEGKDFRSQISINDVVKCVLVYVNRTGIFPAHLSLKQLQSVRCICPRGFWDTESLILHKILSHTYIYIISKFLYCVQCQFWCMCLRDYSP